MKIEKMRVPTSPAGQIIGTRADRARAEEQHMYIGGGVVALILIILLLILIF